MAGILDQLQRPSFGGIAFAAHKYSVKGSFRKHPHEFRHRPGGSIEKLGRKLYEIDFEVNFSTRTPKYPTAFPTDESELRLKFELGETDDLVIPTLGTIRAMCTDWTTEADLRLRRDGESAHFIFLEDQETALLLESGITVHVGSVAPKYQALQKQAEEDIAFESSRPVLEEDATDLFDAIESVGAIVAQIETLRAQAELEAQALTNRLAALSSKCTSIHDQLPALQDPMLHLTAGAMRSLGYAAVVAREDILRKSKPVITFVTPTLMTIQDVSKSLYGATTRSVEILQLNDIDDAFSIRPNTSLRVYAPD